MALYKDSKRNGSADRAWLYVVSATAVLLLGLLIAGPHSARDSSGSAYNPFPEIATRLLGGLALTGKVVVASTVCAMAWGILIGIGRASRSALPNLAASM